MKFSGGSALHTIRVFVILVAALTLPCAFGGPPHLQHVAQDSPNSKKHPAPQEKKRSATEKKSSTHEQPQPSGQEDQDHSESASHSSANSHSKQDASSHSASFALVWINTDTRIFHKHGSKWYGKTKHGKYMTETDALRAGYRPASKEQ